MELKIAGNGKRFLAYLTDILPIVLIMFLLFYFFFGFDETLQNYLGDKDDLEARLRFLVQRNIIRDLSLVVWITYGACMDCSSYRGTYGKFIMGIKVADHEGNRISGRQSVIRNVSKILSIIPLFIGVIWILFDKQHKAWHDKIAKTILIE